MVIVVESIVVVIVDIIDVVLNDVALGEAVIWDITIVV